MFSDSSLRSSVGDAGDESIDQKNLERLEESFASLRVGGRRLRKRENPKKSKAVSCVDSGTEVGSSAVSSVGTDCSPFGDSSVEDRLTVECKVRLQRLKANLLQKQTAITEDSSGPSFDASQSLFETPPQVTETRKLPKRKCKDVKNVSATNSKEDKGSSSEDDDSEWESDEVDEEDLSAIVEGSDENDAEDSELGEEEVDDDEEEEEDVEEEEEEDDEEEEEEDDEEKEDVDEEEEIVENDEGVTDEVEETGEDDDSDVTVEEEEDADVYYSSKEDTPEAVEIPSLDTSALDSSNVRYMLTSMSCADVEEMSFDANTSILDHSSKKSLGANLSRSFAVSSCFIFCFTFQGLKIHIY
jgi:hypothetical protein